MMAPTIEYQWNIRLRCFHWNTFIWGLILWFVYLAPLTQAQVPLQRSPVEPTSKSFQVSHWKSDQGLPANNITSLIQTSDGYIWAGTFFGLARFDGVNFTAYNQIDTPGLINDTCNELVEDRNRIMWIATLGGLVKYQNGRFTHVDLSKYEQMPNEKIWNLFLRSNGELWFRNDGGVVRFHEDSISVYGDEEGLIISEVYSMFEYPSGELGIQTSQGQPYLQVFDPASDKFRSPDPPFRDMDSMSTIPLNASKNVCWLPLRNGLMTLEKGHAVPRPAPPGLPNDTVRSLIQDALGQIWVAFQSAGLYRLLNGQFVKEKFTYDLEDPLINCMINDREGNLWLGTENGLFCLKPRRIETITRNDGLPDNNVRHITSDLNDNIWMSSTFGITRFDGTQFETFHPDGNPNRDYIGSYFVDKKGEVWAGVDKRGIFTLQDKKLRMVLGWPYVLYYCFLEGTDGQYWAGTSEGLLRFHPDTSATEFHSQTNYPFLKQVRVLKETSDGTLWIGTYGQGLTRKNGDQFKTFTTANGLPDNRAFTLYLDEDETLWVGTENGFCRIKEESIFSFERNHGLPETVINQILEDEFGKLWISGMRGIHEVEKSDLNDIAEGRKDKAHWVSYGEADGMASSETNGERQPSGSIMTSGKILIPTIKGFVIVNPRSLQENTVTPEVLIQEVTADSVTLFHDGNLLSPWNRNKAKGTNQHILIAPGKGNPLEIAYTATSFSDPSKVRFQYRLLGLEEKWQEASSRQRRAIYPYLKPGNYQFQVMACNNHGYWSPNISSLDITLAPHFYQTWPFIILCGLALFGVAFGVQNYRLRIQRRILSLESRSALDQQRANLARDMHDDIGASLSQIAILSEVTNKTLPSESKVHSHVEQISSTARSVIDRISELVWTTTPANDTLDNLASYLREYAANYFEPTPVKCHFHLPDSVPPMVINPEIRRGVFLVFKEALHNIHKHAEASQVTIRLVLNQSRIILSVIDNGKGIDRAQPSQKDQPLSNGYGITNMKKRILALGGTLDIESKPSQGTTVRIKLDIAQPLPQTQE